MKLGTCFLLLSLYWAGAAVADVPEYVKAPYEEQVKAWLDAHPAYRLAGENDCQCNDDIESLRKGAGGSWKPQPSYEPYYATGDFNGDGLKDAAVIVVPKGKGQPIQILVFFGQTADSTAKKPVEIPVTGDSVIERGLFSRAPASKKGHKPWKLLFGAFQAEAEEVHIPDSK